MYDQQFIESVQADKQGADREVARTFWSIAHGNGTIEHVEAWEAGVSDGKRVIYGGLSPIVAKGR